MGEIRNAYRILVENIKGEDSFAWFGCRQDDAINIDINRWGIVTWTVSFSD
jgi:hypothetical protein